MPVSYKREDIGPGAYYTELIDKRFKTNYIYVNLLDPMKKENASANALIPDILSETNENYPTVTALSRRLMSLYHSSVSSTVFKNGDCQTVTLMLGMIADKYTINGENISGEAIDIFLDCLTKPYLVNGAFPEEEFRLKKQELLDDIDAEINDKRRYASLRASEYAFNGEPAGIPYIGYREDAEKLKPAAVYERYKELLKTARIEVIFSGYGISENNKSKIFERIRSLDRASAADIKTLASTKKDEPVQVTENMEIEQSKMVMALKSDCDNEYALRLMSAVYGATPFSLLFDNVRERLSLCYYCSSDYNKAKNVIFINSGVEHANIETAREEILNQLEIMKKGDFSEELIENSKRFLKGALRTVYDSPGAAANWYIKQFLKDRITSPEEDREFIDKVTKEDIIAAAKSLTLDTVYVLTGKEKNGNE